MKKLFLMLAICGMALSYTACDKEDAPKKDDQEQQDPNKDPNKDPNQDPNEDPNEDPKDDPTPAEPKYRLHSFNSGGWDTYVYTYNEDGKVVNINRNEGERVWDVAYNGNTITLTGYSEFYIELGDNGRAAYCRDDENRNWYYEYDEDDFIISVKRDEEVKSVATIVNGNCVGWTEEGSSKGNKVHGFLDIPNLAGVHTGYIESGQKRWLVELDWFGKANANICDWNQWESYAGDDSKKSVMTYEYDDETAFVTKETKTYGGKDEVYEFTWELVE